MSTLTVMITLTIVIMLPYWHSDVQKHYAALYRMSITQLLVILCIFKDWGAQIVLVSSYYLQ